MATLEELENGLRKAHAAGNADHARRFADAIRQMRGSQPKQRITAEQARDPSLIPGERYRAAGMEPPKRGSGSSGNRYGDYLAGVGKSIVDTASGIRQYAVDAAGDPANALGPLGKPLLRAVAGDRFDAAAEKSPTLQGVRNYGQRLRNEEAERRRVLPSVSEDPAFALGNVVGTLGQLFTPGAALRGTTAGRAALPTTAGGNALQGLALGTVQPVAGHGERDVNQAVGGLAGWLGAAVPQAVGGTANTLGRMLGGLSSAERAAAQQIVSVAENPAALGVAQPSAVPGVVRTAAQETGDRGVAALERVARGRNPGVFAPIDERNNAARVALLERIAGDDEAMATAEAARNAATSDLRDAAMREGQDYSRMSGIMQDLERARLMLQAQDVAALNAANAPLRSVGGAAPFPVMTQQQIEQQVSGVSRTDLGQLVSRLREISSSNSGNPAVQSTLDRVDSALGDARNSVSGLYNVRKYIDALLTGKAGSDTTAARAATAELMAMKNAVDEEISSRAPTFTDYLSSYREMSKPINRMEFGREMLSRTAAANPADMVGTPLLQAAPFGRAMKDLDAIAARATGFNKAKAADFLTASDLSDLNAIADDMARIAISQRNVSVNSTTDANRYLGDQLANEAAREAAKQLPFGLGALTYFQNKAAAQTQEKMAYLLANPERLREVLAALPSKDRAAVNKVLLQLSARPAAAAPALTE